MFARMLILGLFLYFISFPAADGVSADGLFTDGVSTDGLSLFNDDNIDPLQSIYSLDPTNSDLVSEDLDGFDTFLNDPGSDLFASGVGSITDPTLVAECTSINNDNYLGKKKARTRRQTSCRNPASDFNPNLSLPTLDQVFPADNEDPTPPENRRPDKTMNTVIIPGAWALEVIDLLYKNWTDCPDSAHRICSSDQESDVRLESNGKTWALKSGTGKNSKLVFFLSDFCFRFNFFTQPIFLHTSLFLFVQNMTSMLIMCGHTSVGLYDACVRPRRIYCCPEIYIGNDVLERCWLSKMASDEFIP